MILLKVTFADTRFCSVIPVPYFSLQHKSIARTGANDEALISYDYLKAVVHNQGQLCLRRASGNS